MSISAIRLRNFRGFQDCTIELKPLTVVLGPNSAGKSSFAQAAAVASHAHWIHGGSSQATLSPSDSQVEEWPADLGGVHDLRTEGQEGPILIGFRTSEGWVTLGFGVKGLADLRLSYLRHPKGLGLADGAPADQIPLDLSNVGSSEALPLEPADSSLNDELEIERMNETQWREVKSKEEAFPLLDGLLLRSVERKELTSVALNNTARQELRNFFETLKYLAAARIKPMRGFSAVGGKRAGIGYNGQWTAKTLFEKGRDVFDVPTFSDSNDAIAFEMKKMTLIDGVSFWLERLGLANEVFVVESEPPGKIKIQLRMPGLKGLRDITEVGFGISQVLPVIVGGLLQQKGELVLIDLPEAHLHPRPQAILADYFCALALSNRPLLIESHSEMFFHRLRLLAELIPNLQQVINVYFLDPPRSGICQPPRQVGLTFDDELRWPDTFFKEGWELEAKLSLLRRKSSSSESQVR